MPHSFHFLSLFSIPEHKKFSAFSTLPTVGLASQEYLLVVVLVVRCNKLANEKYETQKTLNQTSSTLFSLKAYEFLFMFECFTCFTHSRVFSFLLLLLEMSDCKNCSSWWNFYTRTNAPDKMYTHAQKNPKSSKRTGKFYEKRTPASVFVCFRFYFCWNPKCIALKFCFFSVERFRVPLSSTAKCVVGEMSRQAANMMKTYLRLNFMWHLKCCCFKCTRFFVLLLLLLPVLVWWKLVFQMSCMKWNAIRGKKAKHFFTPLSLHISMDRYKGMD